MINPSDKKRIKKLNNIQKNTGKCVLYIMSRDQRVDDNFALGFAKKHSEALDIPIKVVFNIYPKVKNRQLNQYEFMIEGLKEVQENLNNKNIDFIVTVGNAVENYLKLEKEFEPAAIYFDFSPLKGPRKVKEDFAKIAVTPCYVVDTHNIVPVWEASDEEEFGAYTLRSKIKRKVEGFGV